MRLLHPGADPGGQQLLERNPNPSEDEVREALSGVLCRCTGYVKPVQAVLRAAAVLRGESRSASRWQPLRPAAAGPHSGARRMAGRRRWQSGEDIRWSARFARRQPIVTRHAGDAAHPGHPAEAQAWSSVGKPEKKVDAVKLVQGKPAFTADIEMRGMLVAKVLHSPVAHARIVRIDASQARALPGVAAVLTWQDIPRVVYSTAGQSDPIPGPLDSFLTG